METYKAVRQLKSGELVSQYIESRDGNDGIFRGAKRLSYNPGEVTEAPENSQGIFTYRDLDEALLYEGNTFEGFTGIVLIYVAYPIGAPFGYNTSEVLGFGYTYKAIRLGTEPVGSYKHIRQPGTVEVDGGPANK